MPIVWKNLWGVQGSKNPSAKLTDEQAYEIRRRYDAGEDSHAIKADMPVSITVVQQIGRRLRWKHLEERK